MIFSYFYTLVFLVIILLLLNIINRFVFMRFLKGLPGNLGELSINDFLDAQNFERILRKLSPEQQERATKTRSWLIRIIFTMAAVILLIIAIGILTFIKKS